MFGRKGESDVCGWVDASLVESVSEKSPKKTEQSSRIVEFKFGDKVKIKHDLSVSAQKYFNGINYIRL